MGVKRFFVTGMWVLLILGYAWSYTESAEPSPSRIEARLTSHIKQFYGDRADVRVQFHSIPSDLQEQTRIRNILFTKIPEGNSDGLCLVEYLDTAGKRQSAYVPFKLFRKIRLFVMKQHVKRGDMVNRTDLTVRETYLNAGLNLYPSGVEELSDKIFKRDIAAGTIITNQMLEDRMSVKKGEVVTVVAESGQLTIRTKAKAMDKGKIGDSIRVRNTSTGREVIGRITAVNTVVVDL